MYVIVLARTPQEGSTYAKRAKLPRGRFRVATSASTIKGLRVAEVHELPSFVDRPDRHAVEAVLRYARGPRLQVEMPERDDRLSVEDALEWLEADIEMQAVDALEQIEGRSDLVAAAIVAEELDAAMTQSTWHRDAVVEALHNDGREKLLPKEDRGEETGTPEPSEAPAPAPKKRTPAKKAAAKPVNTPDFF